MSRIFDWKEVDAALQRAARKGISGTRAERSGRFLLDEPAAPCVRNGTESNTAGADGTARTADPDDRSEVSVPAVATAAG